MKIVKIKNSRSFVLTQTPHFSQGDPGHGVGADRSKVIWYMLYEARKLEHLHKSGR